MAGVCGYQGSYLARIPLQPRNPEAYESCRETSIEGGSRVETHITTPFGPLISITEHKVSSQTLKAELATEEDYRKKTWFLREQADCNEEVAIEHGKIFSKAVGDREYWGHG